MGSLSLIHAASQDQSPNRPQHSKRTKGRKVNHVSIYRAEGRVKGKQQDGQNPRDQQQCKALPILVQKPRDLYERHRIAMKPVSRRNLGNRSKELFPIVYLYGFLWPRIEGSSGQSPELTLGLRITQQKEVNVYRRTTRKCLPCAKCLVFFFLKHHGLEKYRSYSTYLACSRFPNLGSIPGTAQSPQIPSRLAPEQRAKCKP